MDIQSNSLLSDQTLSRHPTCFSMANCRGCPTAKSVSCPADVSQHDPRRHEEILRRISAECPSDGNPVGHGCVSFDVLSGTEDDHSDVNIVRLIAKVRTIAAYAYKKSIGQPTIYPRNDLAYCANFLNMMFAVPAEEYKNQSSACEGTQSAADSAC